MEWMVKNEGRLEHHSMISFSGDKRLHLVGHGEMYYGHWLMTSEELALEKKWDDDWDSASEWNKFADYAIRMNEAAYERGGLDEVYDGDYGKRLYPTHSSLAERLQVYYDGGFRKVLREEIDYNKSIVFRCPWHVEETCNYYRNHPWVVFGEAMGEAPLTWKRAIKERGSDEKAVEFVLWYNEKNGVEGVYE